MDDDKKKVVTFVLFGGTGDLTRKKLVPAFANLVDRGVLSKSSTLIGISRKSFSDKQYKKFLVKSIRNKNERKLVGKLNVKYLEGDFSNPECFKRLKEMMSNCETRGCNRIYYLSTGFKFFPRIVSNLKRYNLNKAHNGYTRIIFEKPFGNNLKSSNLLDKKIHNTFSEEEVYRIDHYLAKETVKNLNVLFFTNPILYSTLNREFVESIQVIVNEEVGVGNRINYYNDAGAIRDMIQNHLLQVLSLILMDRPDDLSPKSIHDAKINVLKGLEVSSARNHLIGQYKSYTSEIKKEGLKEKKTETYAKVELNCKNKRWDGVKLVLRTGKKLRRRFGQIRINFKPYHANLGKGYEGLGNNKIIINIYPKQNVSISMNSRNPVKDENAKLVNFEFSREMEFGPNSIDEYSVLLEEAIKGNKALFARDDEVKEAWKISEKILKMKDKMKFIIYSDGADPSEDILNK